MQEYKKIYFLLLNQIIDTIYILNDINECLIKGRQRAEELFEAYEQETGKLK